MAKPKQELCKSCGSRIKVTGTIVNNRPKRTCDDCRKLRQRVRRVGISVDQYHDMYKAQQGICKLCEINPVRVIDHCYKTGKVRGLLCNGCNLFIGWLEKVGPKALVNLEEYLGD